MQFKEGLKMGWFEMLNARSEYRFWCKDSNIPMHRDVVRRWIESVVILICPVCPHWYVVSGLLGVCVSLLADNPPSFGAGPKWFGKRSEKKVSL